MSSPTQRTLARLREEGYLPAIVEKWNHHAKVRQDLFGFIDILAIRGPQTLAIQACNYSDISTRKKKIEALEALEAVIGANWIVEIWGWRKVKNRYQVRIVRVGV